MGPLSTDGTAVTRLPPRVPRFLVCTAPIVWAASTRAGNILRMIGDAMISVCVTRVPMLSPSSVSVMPLRSSARVMSTTTPGMWDENLRSASRSVPPASTLADGACSASSATAWLESLAATNSKALMQGLRSGSGWRRACVPARYHVATLGRNSYRRQASGKPPLPGAPGMLVGAPTRGQPAWPPGPRIVGGTSAETASRPERHPWAAGSAGCHRTSGGAPATAPAVATQPISPTPLAP